MFKSMFIILAIEINVSGSTRTHIPTKYNIYSSYLKKDLLKQKNHNAEKVPQT